MKNLVMNRPEVIKTLKHKLTFVSDDVINQRIYDKYFMYEYLYDNIEIIQKELQDTANRWREIFNELARTRGWTNSDSLFKYNPLHNYDMESEMNHKRTPDLKFDYDSTRTPNLDTTQTDTPDLVSKTSNSGFNESGSDAVTLAEKVENQGKSTSVVNQRGNEKVNDHRTETGEDKIKETEWKRGNIGVMSTQQLIEQERDLIIDCVKDYVDKFVENFMITM